MAIKTLDTLTDLQGKTVLVRGSVNVPVHDGHVVDPYRIEMIIPTLQYLRDQGAKIILCGHIGNGIEGTLEPVARYLQDYMPTIMVRDIFDANIQDTIHYAAPGSIILLENLRQFTGETTNDEVFVKHLASLADIYVNDAFPVCHREHASIVGVPKFLPSYAGIQLALEIKHLSKAFTPTHPFVFILGGAKVSTKMPLMERFHDKANTLFVGGVLANDFFKAMKKEIGKSTISDTVPSTSLLEKQKITLPSDVVVLRNGHKENVSCDEVISTDAIFDAGKKTVAALISEIKKAKLIVWNGPLGYCEEDFCDATQAIAEAIAQSGALSIVGGGDTLAAIDDKVQSKFSFVSTGGGAMLDYLSDGKLPGITALES